MAGEMKFQNSENSDKQKAQENQSLGTPMTFSGSGGQVGPMSRTATFSSGSQPGGANSGRFTNLQKYLGANTGAGQRLAGAISSKIGQGLEPEKKQFETQANKIGEAINKSKEAIEKTAGYTQQVSGPNFDPTKMQEQQVNEFGQLRTGSYIKPSELTGTAQAASSLGEQLSQQTAERAGQLASEAGRFGLLKEAFGGGRLIKPAYSSGQQRLDQLFLQAGGANDLNKLQTDLQKQQTNLQQQLSGISGQQNIIEKNIADYQKAREALQNATSASEAGFYSQGQEAVNAANRQIEADQARAREIADILTGKVKPINEADNVTDKELRDLGLVKGLHTWGELGPDSQWTAERLYNFDPRRVQSFGDIAKAEDVAKAQAWAALSGQQAQFNKTGSMVSPNGELIPRTTAKQDLANRLRQKEQEFNEAAGKTNIESDVETGTIGWQDNSDGASSGTVYGPDYARMRGGTTAAQILAGNYGIGQGRLASGGTTYHDQKYWTDLKNQGLTDEEINVRRNGEEAAYKKYVESQQKQLQDFLDRYKYNERL